MDVKDLCLGMLTFGDASSYDIKKLFAQSFRHFCMAGYGSIYPALAKLTAAGLMSCHTQVRESRPNHKFYRITAKGRRVFIQRLAGSIARHQIKSEFLVLMYFGRLLPAERFNNILKLCGSAHISFKLTGARHKRTQTASRNRGYSNA